MLDGELVILGEGKQEFDGLGSASTRRSRGCALAGETPARFVAFDLLSRTASLNSRFRPGGARLEKLAKEPLGLIPSTLERADAEQWLHGAEGVIAKELDAPYRPGERTGMVKVKRVRTIDSVVVGWRPGKEEGTLGSLILGLYNGGRTPGGRPYLRLQGQAET